MSKFWVVVADKSKARIFTVDDPRGALLGVHELKHPEALEREQELSSDRPGRSFDSMGQGRHAMGSTVEPGKQETIRFGVSDSGPGIPERHIPRLTERFYRVDKGRSRQSGGTGLGLAIVKHIISRHEGELIISSKEGYGSRFICAFPEDMALEKEADHESPA